MPWLVEAPVVAVVGAGVPVLGSWVGSMLVGGVPVVLRDVSVGSLAVEV